MERKREKERRQEAAAEGRGSKTVKSEQ